MDSDNERTTCINLYFNVPNGLQLVDEKRRVGLPLLDKNDRRNLQPTTQWSFQESTYSRKWKFRKDSKPLPPAPGENKHYSIQFNSINFIKSCFSPVQGEWPRKFGSPPPLARWRWCETVVSSSRPWGLSLTRCCTSAENWLESQLAAISWRRTVSP